MRDDPRKARDPTTCDGVARRFYAGAPLILSDDGVGMTGEPGDGPGPEISETSIASLDRVMGVPSGAAGFSVTARLPGLVA